MEVDGGSAASEAAANPGGPGSRTTTWPSRVLRLSGRNNASAPKPPFFGSLAQQIVTEETALSKSSVAARCQGNSTQTPGPGSHAAPDPERPVFLVSSAFRDFPSRETSPSPTEKP